MEIISAEGGCSRCGVKAEVLVHDSRWTSSEALFSECSICADKFLGWFGPDVIKFVGFIDE